jgi:hypothetical protein
VNEIEYLNTNAAVIRPALEEARRLWGLDLRGHDTASQQVDERQSQHLAATTAGDLQVHLLKAAATVKQAEYIDHTTVAFAAAYLDHYATSLNLRETIRDKHIPKLLVKIAKEHSAIRRSDHQPILQSYDTAGSFLDSLVHEYMGKRKQWKMSSPGHGRVQISWADLPQLIAISKIVTANMGNFCDNYAQMKAHGLNNSPFEAEGRALGYICAGSPLFTAIIRMPFPMLSPTHGPQCRQLEAARRSQTQIWQTQISASLWEELS